MTFILTLFFFILIISVLVFVHELGHFIAAKLLRVDVKQFAIGFGNSIVSKKYKGTVYSIRTIPMGGFVELEGEKADLGPNSFRNKPLWAKAIVLLAGVTMNFLIAIVLFAGYLALKDYKFYFPDFSEYKFHNISSEESFFPVTVTSIDLNGNSVGQLYEGDNIVEIGGQRFKSYTEFLSILRDNQQKNIEFKFIDIDTFDVSSRSINVGEADSEGHILNVGLIYEDQLNKPTYFLTYNKSVKSAFSMTFDMFFYQIKIFESLLKDAFSTGNFTEVSESVGGLPKVGGQINEVVKYKAYDVLILFAALISLSLILFNVLPIPALDGGQLAIYSVETALRRRFSDKLINRLNLAGFVFIIGLGIIINIKDIIELKWVENAIDFVKNSLGR